MEVHRFKPVPQKGAGLILYILTKVLLYVKELRTGMNFSCIFLLYSQKNALPLQRFTPGKNGAR